MSKLTGHLSVINGRVWSLWVLVCAVTPVLYAITSAAFNKPVLATDPNVAWLPWAIGSFILIALPLPTVLQWGTLRLLAPGLKLWEFFLAIAVAGLISIGVELVSLNLRISLLQHRADAYVQLLPWLRLIGSTLATAAIMCIPACVVARHSSRHWGAFVAAACCGTVVVGLLEWLYALYFFRTDTQSLNGLDWLSRLNILLWLLGCGALWGATTATTLVFLGRKKVTDTASKSQCLDTNLWIIAAGTAAIALLTPAIQLAIGDYGVRAGYTAILKAVKFAPTREESVGDSILLEPREIDFTAPKYPVAALSPDGKTFIALSANRKLTRLDLSSGANLGMVGEPLRQYERYDIDWSPDGQYAVLRTDGSKVNQPDSPYTKHLNRLRLYEASTFKQIADFAYLENLCIEVSGVSVRFSSDSKSIWARCGQFYSPHKALDVIAVQLEVPSMKLLNVRTYGEYAKDGSVQSMASFQSDVAFWQRGAASELFVRSLTSGKNIIVLRDLPQKSLAGALTSQEVTISDNSLHLRYCGQSTDVSNPTINVQNNASAGHSFCRILKFGIPSGILEEMRDYSPLGATESELLDHQEELKVRGVWNTTDKSGELIVFDTATGRERQRISTIAQRPLKFSPDGKMLLVHAKDANKLRVYKVAR